MTDEKPTAETDEELLVSEEELEAVAKTLFLLKLGDTPAQTNKEKSQ